MKSISIIALTILSFSLFSCGEKKQEKKVAPPVEVVEVEEVVEAIPEPVKVEPKKAKFFVIAGCFEVEENAVNLTNKLNEEGYEAEMIPFSKERNLVSFGGYLTKDEAQTALNNLTYKKNNRGLWIHDVQ